MIIIGRPINGIAINGLEYILNEDGTEKLFESKTTAKQFLLSIGEIEDNLDDCYQYVELL